jgi:6-pyruvoyltetrahydropterin/6-carboxytetrahydropterin synthase
MAFQSTKIIELGSCAFRQPKAYHSHCRFVHGYKLSAKFWFSASSLDENHWVVDFGGLKGLKKILQDQFDHTTCIAADDPALPAFKELVEKGACDLRVMPSGTGVERIAEWCYSAANKFVSGMTDNRAKCTRVEVFEHENNSAIYESRDLTKSGSAYMEEKADEIEAGMTIIDETIKIDVEKPVSNKKDANITRPPFKPSQKKSQPLFPKKQTNKWINPDSTWGL